VKGERRKPHAAEGRKPRAGTHNPGSAAGKVRRSDGRRVGFFNAASHHAHRRAQSPLHAAAERRRTFPGAKGPVGTPQGDEDGALGSSECPVTRRRRPYPTRREDPRSSLTTPFFAPLPHKTERRKVKGERRKPHTGEGRKPGAGTHNPGSGAVGGFTVKAGLGNAGRGWITAGDPGGLAGRVPEEFQILSTQRGPSPCKLAPAFRGRQEHGHRNATEILIKPGEEGDALGVPSVSVCTRGNGEVHRDRTSRHVDFTRGAHPDAAAELVPRAAEKRRCAKRGKAGIKPRHEDVVVAVVGWIMALHRRRETR